MQPAKGSRPPRNLYLDNIHPNGRVAALQSVVQHLSSNAVASKYANTFITVRRYYEQMHHVCTYTYV